MQWNCKSCDFISEKRGHLLKHYRLKHGSYTRTAAFPCLHQECLCTFNSINALKVHLSKIHPNAQEAHMCETAKVTFHCQLCDFSAPCTEAVFLTHLRSTHLKVNNRVQCPYKGCYFHTSVYSTFNAHRSMKHRTDNWRMFKPEIVSSVTIETAEEEHAPSNHTTDLEDGEDSSNDDLHDLGSQLEHNLAALFLKMQTILHIPESSVQDVIRELLQMCELSQPLLHNAVKEFLKQHMDVDDSTVSQLVKAASESNVILRYCGKDGSLSTTKRREKYVNKNFAVVMPVEYIIDQGNKSSAVYVPLHAMLQKMLNKADILDKALPVLKHVPHEYSTYRDGIYCKENDFLNGEEFKIAVGLYIDDFEVSNPLGTSKKKHKMCAVYWVIANVPSKYRSTLHSIQLAILCKTTHVKEYGYSKILHPLIQDLVSLEQQGLYVENLGACVKGTVLYVAADNLAAHSLAGFFESFTVYRFCRFCMATRSDIQDKDVSSATFEPRTKETHNRQVQEVHQDPTLAREYGVKRGCVLTDSLEHFHVISGYPPDILHDLLEGVVPAELALCISDLISKKYFTLETLNHAIKSFAYVFSDKTDQPQPIARGFAKKGTIGGNGHENWALIRLLPLLIGQKVPEGDNAWTILMLLKDIVELAVATRHSEESIQFLDCKVSEHRELLQTTFPNFRLRPKHHFIEHYPEKIKAFGPLSDVWTMRFEGKHKFFKRAIRNAHNFRNVALTLAVKHQKMMAYCLDSSSFFKPSVQMEKVTTASITSYPENVQQVFSQKVPQLATVLVASSIFIDGIKYCADMILSAGSCAGLPKFQQIKQIVAVNADIFFVCNTMTAWYHEHFRSFELHGSINPSLCVVQLKELNDVFPLSAYRFGDNLIVTLRRYIQC